MKKRQQLRWFLVWRLMSNLWEGVVNLGKTIINHRTRYLFPLTQMPSCLLSFFCIMSEISESA